MSVSSASQPRVGKLRPTQVISQQGPGSIVDLPELSVIIAGLDEWQVRGTDRIVEPRLEAFLRVTRLFRPPYSGPGTRGGVPAYVFPEWLVCPFYKCRMLAHKDNFDWVHYSGEFRCPRRARHGGNTMVIAFPARLMVACPKGHLDDFPWDSWVHDKGGRLCDGFLRLVDEGRSGSINDLVVSCRRCSVRRRMGGVFDQGVLEDCSGRRPWLGPSNREIGCEERSRVLLRGASNSYFSIVASALSIPPYSEAIQTAIAQFSERLEMLDTVDDIVRASSLGRLDNLLSKYRPDELLAATKDKANEIEHLRPDEYQAFLNPPGLDQSPREFEVRHVDVPPNVGGKITTVGAATRLREVRALWGFTRIESGFDIGELVDVAELDINVAPIGLSKATWLPAVELRGEGIFLSLNQQAVHDWEGKPRITRRAEELSIKFREYQADRSDSNTQPQSSPRMHYVLLHSLAHSLIRRLCLNSGYSSSALRERLYSTSGDQLMAGLLIYTASSDSEGSLGGLVDQAQPERFGPVLHDSLQDARLCAQDPLCGADEIGGAAGLNGAACHACLLLPETSCEAGNRFLDRATLVETIGQFGRQFFDEL